MQEIDR